MANKVREHNELKGLGINDKSIDLKLLLYGWHFIACILNSFENILNVLECFGEVAGPKLNREKTRLDLDRKILSTMVVILFWLTLDRWASKISHLIYNVL